MRSFKFSSKSQPSTSIRILSRLQHILPVSLFKLFFNLSPNSQNRNHLSFRPKLIQINKRIIAPRCWSKFSDSHNSPSLKFGAQCLTDLTNFSPSSNPIKSSQLTTYMYVCTHVRKQRDRQTNKQMLSKDEVSLTHMVIPTTC